MAIRVTAEEVLDIMDSDVDVSTTAITAMITAASAIIDKVFEDDGTMTDAMLKEVERWLTAHFVASTLARMAAIEKIGDAAITYVGKWKEGLDSTPYGQMAKILDITGKLAKAGKTGASVYAIPNFDD